MNAKILSLNFAQLCECCFAGGNNVNTVRWTSNIKRSAVCMPYYCSRSLWYNCLLGLLASVTDGSWPWVISLSC